MWSPFSFDLNGSQASVDGLGQGDSLDPDYGFGDDDSHAEVPDPVLPRHDADALSLLDDDITEPQRVWEEVVGTEAAPEAKLTRLQDHVSLLRQMEDEVLGQLEYEQAKIKEAQAAKRH